MGRNKGRHGQRTGYFQGNNSAFSISHLKDCQLLKKMGANYFL